MKKSVSIDLDSDVISALEKRAKKNFMSLREQIEDIIRRSVIASKKKPYSASEDKEDGLLSAFSRRGKKR